MDAKYISQQNLHGLMGSVGARHTGELRFESLLRHFFKNLTQHLALPESPAGQTVRHQLFTSSNQWMNHSKSGGPSVLVDKYYSGQFVRWFIHGGPTVWWTDSLVDNPEVDETTMNQISRSAFVLNASNFLECTFLKS